MIIIASRKSGVAWWACTAPGSFDGRKIFALRSNSGQPEHCNKWISMSTSEDFVFLVRETERERLKLCMEYILKDHILKHECPLLEQLC